MKVARVIIKHAESARSLRKEEKSLGMKKRMKEVDQFIQD